MKEAQPEVAAGGEPGRRFASDEFFFLLQRVDRLDEKMATRIDAVMTRIDAVDAKLTGRVDAVMARIDAVDGKLTARIDEVRRDLDGLRTWVIGLLFTVLAGFGGVIVALLRR